MRGWQPLLRIARRDALRHRGRSLLVVLLVGVPVAAMSAFLSVASTARLTAEQEVAASLGQADLSLVAAGVEPEEWQALLPAGSRWIEVKPYADSFALVQGDELFEGPIFEGDLDDPLLEGRWDVVDGRAAQGEDEVVLSGRLARDLGAEVGDELALRRPGRAVTVVGLAVAASNQWEQTLLVPPGWSQTEAQGVTGGSTEWLIDLAGPNLVRPDVEAAIARIESRFPDLEALSGLDAEQLIEPAGPDAPRFVEIMSRAHLAALQGATLTGQVSSTYVIGALALAWTGGVAVAAFAVGARRRLREIGLVAASGGDPGQLRRMLLADGVVLGLAGALGGATVGVGIAAAARPHLDRLVDHTVGPLRVPFMALAGAALVGFVAAVLAALVPAREAARVPVLAALAGRRPVRPRTRSWLAFGVVALALGVGLCWWGGDGGSEAAVIGGVLFVVAGVSAATGPLLGLVSQVAGAIPLSLRLAARDAGRSRSRTAPATVAAMLALAGAVGGVTMVRSNEAEARASYRAEVRDDQIQILIASDQPPAPEDVRDLIDAAVGAVPGSVGGPLAFAFEGAGAAQSTVQVNGDWGLAVGDLATLDALGASAARAAFEDGKVVGLGRGTVEGNAVTFYRYGADGPESTGQHLAAVEVGDTLPVGPRYLLSFAAADALGFETQASQVVVRAPRSVTDADVRRVNLAVLQAAPSVTAMVQRDSGPPALAPLLAGMLGAGALVALFVVTLVTALSREELRPHLATLAAVGAGPRTRRRLAAAQSGLLGGMAALLAVPTGLVPAVTLRQSRTTEVLGPAGDYVVAAQPIVVPWLLIAALAVSVTLLSAAGGGLFTRSRSAP